MFMVPEISGVPERNRMPKITMSLRCPRCTMWLRCLRYTKWLEYLGLPRYNSQEMSLGQVVSFTSPGIIVRKVVDVS